jgi:REP element-mobilizing transposase RayT
MGSVKEFVEEQLETIAQTKGYKILEARVMPDHIHLFITTSSTGFKLIFLFPAVNGLYA